MPGEDVWSTYFDAHAILDGLGLLDSSSDAVDFGSGYGTFSLELAAVTSGVVYAIDIDQQMVDLVQERAAERGLANVVCICRDFVAHGTGLADASVGRTLLFNILHAENPVGVLREAHRVLAPDGRLAVIHWVHDRATPRGPDLSIRPRPEDCLCWMREAGFDIERSELSLPPYHYGLTGIRSTHDRR